MPASQTSPRRLLLVVLSLVLAGIPPALVVSDRWFGAGGLANSLRGLWCRSPFLCATAWPAYFLIIFACTLLVLGIMLGLRAGTTAAWVPQASGAAAVPSTLQRQVALGAACASLLAATTILIRLPKGTIAGGDYALACASWLVGWWLYDHRAGDVWESVKKSWSTWAASVLGLAAVCRVLFDRFALGRITIVSVVLVVVAAACVYLVRRRLSAGYWLMLLAVILFTQQLNAWYFAFIGDEYIFYDAARGIADHPDLSSIARNLFNGTFVYDTHPFLASLLQAPTIWLFDTLNFGWRFSSIAASAFSVAFFYYFFRTFLPKWVAIVAGFLIAVSHYLMSFSRIGHDITQAVLAMGLACAAAALAIRRPRSFSFAVAGAALAFCFYTFPAALYVTPVVLWLLLLYHPPRSRPALGHWAVLLATTLLLLLPLFSQPAYWSSKMGGTLAAQENANAASMSVTQHVLLEFGYAFYSFLAMVNESHFVTVAYVDPVTGALVLIGLGALLSRLRHDKFAFFVLSSFGALLFLVGASHQYATPPNTRMLLLVPWLCLIAAVGLQWLAGEFRFAPAGGKSAAVALGALLSVVLALNLYQAYDVSVRLSAGRYEYFEALFPRLAQNITNRGGVFPGAVTLIYEPLRQDPSRLKQIVQLEYLPVVVHEIPASSQPASDLAAALATPQKVVALSPLLSPEANAAYAAQLGSRGLSTCRVTALTGSYGYDVWYSGGLPSPCKAPSNGWPDLERWILTLVVAGCAVAFVYIAGRSRERWLSPVSNAVHDARSWLARLGAGVSARAAALQEERRKRSRISDGKDTGGTAPIRAGGKAAPRRVASRPNTSARSLPPQEAPDARQRLALLILIVALAFGAAAVWALRQPWAMKFAAPWWILLAAMFACAMALRQVNAWLPGRTQEDQVAHFASARNRKMGLWCIAGALAVTAGVVLRLWPDYANRWQWTPLLWVVALALFAAGGWLIGLIGEAAPRARTAVRLWDDTPRNRWLEGTAFAIILAVAIFLRIYRLDSVPPAIWRDISDIGLDAITILRGRMLSPFALTWGETPALYTYGMAALLRLVGVNWTALQLLSSIPGILTVPAVYVLARRMFGPLPGLIAMFLMAVSRWHLTMSRSGWVEVVPPFFQVLSLYFLMRALRERRALDYVLAGLTAGLSLYTYLSARLALATLAIFLVYWILSDRDGLRASVRRNGVGLALILGAVLVTAAPLAVTYLKDPQAWGARTAQISVMRDVESQGTSLPLLQNLGDMLRFFHQAGDRNGRYNLPGEPMLDPINGLLFAIGVAYAILGMRDPRRVLLLLWLIIGLAGSYLSARLESPQAFRSLTALPAAILMSADILDHLARVFYGWLRTLAPSSRAAGLPAFGMLAFIGLVVAGAAGWDIRTYFGPQASSVVVQRAFSLPESMVARAVTSALQAGDTVYTTATYWGATPVKVLAYGTVRDTVHQNPLDNPPYRLFDPGSSLPLSDDGHDAVLLLDSDLWVLRNYFNSFYPQARAQLVTLSDGSPVYMRVDVPSARIAALQGLRETETYSDGRGTTQLTGRIEATNDGNLSNVTWDGSLRVQESGEYMLSAGNAAQVSIDGQLWTGSHYLGRGLYTLHVTATPAAQESVQLVWARGDAAAEAVPPTALFHLPGPVQGIVASYWNNVNWEGPPLFHQVVPYLVMTWPPGQESVPTTEFSASFTGLLHVDRAGTYSFRVIADDGARLTLDGKVLGEGLVRGRANEFEATVDLVPGDHPISVDYFQAGGASGLGLFWHMGDESWTPVLPSALLPAQPQ